MGFGVPGVIKCLQHFAACARSCFCEIVSNVIQTCSYINYSTCQISTSNYMRGYFSMGDPQVHHRLTYAQHFDELVDEIVVLFHG